MARLYRQLQANYTFNFCYDEAGDFYVREQELIRNAKGKVSRWLCARSLYNIVSNYGQSYLRPLFWLIIILLLSPAVWLYTGLLLGPQSGEPRSSVTNYDWSLSPSDFLLFTSDYWDAFCLNLSFLGFNREGVCSRMLESYQHLLVTVETLLVAVMVTLFVLALRRLFMRKGY